jgi:AbrB family looped-hinge helix DNA binding protein
MKSGIATLTSKGQLTVPAGVRGSLGIHPGDRLQFEITGPDTMTVRVRKKHDVFELLKALPPLKSAGPLDRDAIAAAADAALGPKFADMKARPR